LTKLKKVDVCIIGSGAGGGVVAKELGEHGIKVVVLEAGRRFHPLQDYTPARADWEALKHKAKTLFTVPALELSTSGNKSKKKPHETHGVGGGTLAYYAYAVRMRPDDFNVYSTDGVGMDWPTNYEDLVPYYRKVELELGVSGLAGDPWTPLVKPYLNPPFEFSYANKIIKRGCDKLGIKLWPAPMARLSKPFDQRPACVQCGLCDMGCMSGAKSSVDVTFIRKAEATGNVIIQPQCIVTRIKIDGQGKAKSVIYYDIKGVEHEQKADVIVLSAGSIQTPRLLLNSKSNIFPDGLANRSGLVGKYFMQHLAITSAAIFPDRIDSFRGFYGGAISQDFTRTASTQAFARGWRLDPFNGVRGPIEMAKYSLLWGNRLKEYMRKNYGHVAGILTSGEQLPDKRNCIELDPLVKDQYGMPVPRITFAWRRNDRLIRAAMEANIREIYDAAGASEMLYFRIKPGGSSHNMGTCRMGDDPKTSVLNSFCQSHDVPNLFVIDASCFVTSGTANPSLTIHAIATRASEHILDQGQKGNL
jgi:choline dehydrogenase-like flavoprotein